MSKQNGKYHLIVTHILPHLDEIAAIWMLRRFGEKKFPGISEAVVQFWTPSDKDAGQNLAETFSVDGVLLVGVGGGQFDEHPTLKTQGKQGECATTLVAKVLGIEDDPALEKILKFVTSNDLKAVTHPFDLAALSKALYRKYPDKPIQVVEWAIVALDAKYQEQLEFLTETKQEFEQKAKIEEVQGPNGRMLKMVTVVSNNELINRFARSTHGCQAAIVIQQQSNGNTQIYTNRQTRLTLYDVAQMLRLAEQEAKTRIVTTDWKMLAREGKVEGAEEWYFFEAGQMLLNGSLTAKDVPPTHLSLEEIGRIVKIGINPNFFEPDRSQRCKQGVCSSTQTNLCPLYKLGLQRCRKIRFTARQ